MHRIQIYLKESGVLCQDQTAYLYGKDTSIGSMHILNALETLQEFRSELFMSSWDFKTAFDSVTRPLLVYGGIRVGIPSELMSMLVDLDIGGLTILRSPAALESLNKQSNFRLIDLGFSAQIGTGQGGVEGPLSWDFVIDILLVALRDTKLKDQFWTRDSLGVNRPTREQTFADDILSICATQEALQTKCDFVCAFSMITGIRISREKFRCFHIQNNNAMRPPQLDHLLVRTRRWEESDKIYFQFSGDLKHLGVLYDIAMENDSQYSKAKSQMETCCAFTSSRHSSSEAKLTHTGRSTLMQLAYYSKYMNWPKKQWDNLEAILNKHYRKLTYNLPSFPAKLLNIRRCHGGLGLQSFTDLVNDNKLRVLHAMMHNSRDTNHDISSMISRSMSSSGVFCTAESRCLVKESFDMKDERWWATSLIQYLSLAGVGLEKNGVDVDHDTDKAVALLSADDSRILWSTGIYSIGELFLVGDSAEIFRNLRLSSDLRTRILSNPTNLGTLTPRPGQVWGYDKCNALIEILGFTINTPSADGIVSFCAHVIYWKRFKSRTGNRLLVGQRVFLKDDDFGQSYCTGSGSRESVNLSDIIDTYDTLISLTKERPIESSMIPSLIGITTCSIGSLKHRRGRIPDLQKSFRSHIPDDISKGAGRMNRAVTDGSYKKHESTADFLLGTFRVVAGGAVVCYNEAGDSYLIKIRCDEPLTKSAYNPELYALALATVLANSSAICPTEIELYSDCMSAINSVRRSLTGNFKYSPLMWPLLGISRSTLPKIEHVKGHPEKRLPPELWSWKDCGIALADRVAGSFYPPDSTITDHMVVDIVSSSLPFRLVNLNEWYKIPGSLALKSDFSLQALDITRRRRPLMTDIKDIISMNRRVSYYQLRDTIHSSSVAVIGEIPDEIGVSLQHHKFNWHSSSNNLAVMMFDMKKTKVSRQSSNVRLVYDKHYETNRGKREGSYNECPLCGYYNLNAAHVINQCSHPLVLMARYQGKLEFDVAVSIAVNDDFHELRAIIKLIKDNNIGFHIQHGIVPGELKDLIRLDSRLWNSHSGKRKSSFNRCMKLMGTATARTMSVFMNCLYTVTNKPKHSTTDIVRHTRLLKGGLPVRRRNKKKPVLFMSQFLQPPLENASIEVEPVAEDVSPTFSKIIKMRLSNQENTISLVTDVQYNSFLQETATTHFLDLALDPGRETPLITNKFGITLRTTSRPWLYSDSRPDPGFSGYTVMYALYNDGRDLNIADYKDRMTLRSFISSVSCKAGSIITKEEFEITADFIIKNPYTVRMSQACCLWLSPHDIMSFEDAPRCIFWESTSVRGDVIETSIDLTIEDLMEIRTLPHVVIDNNEYSILALPYEVEPDQILLAVKLCTESILADVVGGSVKDDYIGII